MAASSAASHLFIAVVQANPTVGDLTGNLNQILAARRAHPNADVVVLSECFLTGYPLQDLVTRPGFITEVGRTIQQLTERIAAEPGPAVLFGAPTPGADLPYNSAILIRPDGTMAVTHKQELPNNGVFDEKRTFAPGGGKAMPLQYKGWSLGVGVCEDMWHAKVAADLVGEGADILIFLNGSPCKIGKADVRINHARRRVADTGLPLIYCNQVGAEGQLVFDGASFALDAKANLAMRMNAMQPDDITLHAERDRQGRVTIEPPHERLLASNVGKEQLMWESGVLGLRDYMDKQGIPRIFIGNSGGKDSAAALAIAVDAVGPDRVVSVRLPSQYTSQESMDLADELARNLGVRCETVCIDGPVRAFASLLAASPATNQTSADVADENIQARVRMMILMDMAKRQGGIVAGTSNKSESALGYGTLFADFGGDYNTIKDWYATEVPQNLLWRNAHKPAISLHPITGHIPLGIINRKPTAELRPDQSDAESLGAGYDVIDPILMGLIEDGLDATAARRQAEAQLNMPIEPGFAAALENRLYGAEFKRSLVNVPGPQIREASFGLGRRYPIVNHYRSTERNPA